MTVIDQLGTRTEAGLDVVSPEGGLSDVYGGLGLEDEDLRSRAFDARFTAEERQAIYLSGVLEALIAEVQGGDSGWLAFRLESIQNGDEPDSLVVCCRGLNRQLNGVEHYRIIRPQIEASLQSGYNPDQIRLLAGSVLPEDYIPPYRFTDHQPYLGI
jgi:hypothetical protein